MAETGFLTASTASAVIPRDGYMFNRAAPISPVAAVFQPLIDDALEISSLLIPLASLARSLAPRAAATEAPKCVIIETTGSSDFVLGDLTFSGVVVSTGGVDSTAAQSGSVTVSFTPYGSATPVTILSDVVTEEELACYLLAMARLLTTGYYEGLPQFVNTLARSNVLPSDADARIMREGLDDNLFKVTSALGIDSQPSYFRGAIVNPASLAKGSAWARASLALLESQVWPNMMDWLKGALDAPAMSTYRTTI